MKKILILLLCVTLAAVALTSCGKNAASTDKEKVNTVKLKVDQTYTIKDHAEFTLLKISTTPKIMASMGGNTFFASEHENETFIDIVFAWTNIGEKAVEESDIILAKAINSKGTEYRKSFNAIETNDATDLVTSATISPDTTVKLHCAITVPTSENQLTLTLRIVDQEYVFDYALGTIESNATPLAVGDVVDAADNARMAFLGIEYTDDLLPSNTEGMYTHYSVDDPAATYLVVRFDITSQRESAHSCDSFVHIDALYSGQYRYSGFVVVEDEDGKGFSGYTDISPLTTRHFYYLFKVPKTEIENRVDLTIVFNNQEYAYTYQ